jgi:S-adenosylmethionine synthetase
MQLVLQELIGPPIERREVEIVERKGLGHPDTICDALAEELSLALSRWYLEHAGGILHHNVDKVLLFGGSAEPSFGGGRIEQPIEIYLCGRATAEFEGRLVPIEELAVEGSRRWLRENLHALDPAGHVRIHPLVRHGSPELVELYRRQRESGCWLANDTSCGVGYAPLSELENLVLNVERALTRREATAANPEVGEDVKLMGVRHGEAIHLTVACAFVARHVRNFSDYEARKAALGERAAELSRAHTQRPIEIDVNTADDPATESVYLTVTGTSAEGGDDGEAGRGNRVNGLISPYRPMTMESVAGKNPVTHVGKLYNVLAGLIAEDLVAELSGVNEATCHLVSQIGRPVDDPQLADVRLRTDDPAALEPGKVEPIVRDHLAHVDTLWKEIATGAVAMDRWPLRRRG